MCNSMHIMSKRDLLGAFPFTRKPAPSKPLPGYAGWKDVAFFQLTLGTKVTFPEGYDGSKISSTLEAFKKHDSTISGIAIMRMRYVLVLVVLVSCCFWPSGTAQSQQASSTGARRVVQKMSPVYPDIAKRMNLAGTVKVVAVVLADGMVKSVEPVGGSPVLLKAAQDAVVKWRFAPGGESRELIELHFDPQ
jgi:hypothetical protein